MREERAPKASEASLSTGRMYTRDELIIRLDGLSVRRIIRLSINPKTNFAP